MKKLHWLVLKSYARPFLMSFSIVMFILVVQFVSVYMDKIAGKGISGDVFIKLFVYAAGKMIITALPVGVLAGALITFGNLGENYELAAIKSSGISLFRFMKPVILLSALLMAFSFYASFYLIPQANLKFFSLLYDVTRKKPDVALQPGHFYTDIDGYVIRVSDKDKDRGTLFDVLIYDHTDNRGNTDIILADSAHTQTIGGGMALKMTLYHGARHEEYPPEAGRPNTLPYGRTYFDSLYYTFNLSGFQLDRTDEKQFKHEIIMPLGELRVAIDSLKLRRESQLKKYITQLSRNNLIDTLFTQYRSDSIDFKSYIQPYDFEGKDPLVCLGDDEKLYDYIDQAMVDIRGLKSYLDFVKNESKEAKKTLRKFQYEYYNRYAMPINVVLFMLIGVSLGAIIRKGGLGAPSIISVILFMMFYVLITQGKKMSKQGVIEPVYGAWLPIMVFLPLAIIVTYQATTDSKVLDESVWGMARDRVQVAWLTLREKLSRKQYPGEYEEGQKMTDI